MTQTEERKKFRDVDYEHKLKCYTHAAVTQCTHTHKLTVKNEKILLHNKFHGTFNAMHRTYIENILLSIHNRLYAQCSYPFALHK